MSQNPILSVMAPILGGSGCAEKIYGRSIGCVLGRCCVNSIPENLLKRVTRWHFGV